MWIVRLALRRPYTIVVLAILVSLFGVLSARRMSKDIFPTIDIPVVIVVWTYPGLSTEDMEKRVVLLGERAFSTTVNGISRLESQSIEGIGVVKVYFEPGTDIGAAIAQITSFAATVTNRMPPGITPPAVIQFNASNVQVGQLTLSSDTLPEQDIFDHAFYFLRLRLFTVPGLSVPEPYGGKRSQISVDLDPVAAAARGLSPQDVVTSLLQSNILVPAGAVRIGHTEYDVTVNNSPKNIDEFARIPIKTAGGAIVLLGDIARIHAGYAVQNNIVRVNGSRATYVSLVKKASGSTLAVIDATKDMMPAIKEAAPAGLEVKLDFDQSIFVREAVSNVVREGAIAAILVSLMVFTFLGSWRSVIIVSTSIPMAIAIALIALYLLDESLNTMTLGGLSLAIGMLVDDATVEIENIHRNRSLGKPLTAAILDGAAQIATPAFAATSVICIVFLPVMLLTGPARSLFTALGWSVVIAMMASYFLSRTLVPALSRKLMKSEHAASDRNALATRVFDHLQRFYAGVLDRVLENRLFVTVCAVGVAVAALGLSTVVGTDFFPDVDAGQMRLHVRAPIGTRIEDTEQLVAQIEHQIRQIIPAQEVETINDMIGVPTSLNLMFVQTDSVGGQDADILIALKEGHAPTKQYERAIRKALPDAYPGTTFYFQPADILNQVLDFGLPAAINVEVEGKDLDSGAKIAGQLRDKIRGIPGAVDVHIAQALTHPALKVDVSRERAAQIGVSQRDVANNVLTSLTSSLLVAPSFYLADNGINYAIAVQTPISRVSSVGEVMSIPLAPSGQAGTTTANMFTSDRVMTPTLADLATITPSQTRGMISHDAVQRVVEVRLGVDGRDLGAVSADIDDAIASLGKLPPGTKIHVRGQTESMHDSFYNLGLGVILATVLAFLLLVVLFQSFIDPLIIIIAVPGALIGVLIALALTGSTLNVESLMGMVMSVGVATSNSILLVSFANDVRKPDKNGFSMSAMEAAKLAGRTRLRPVLMTALAMILGMIPIAVGHGAGGEQNAPLARAVIGGLTIATLVTLFIVPIAYSRLRKTPHETDDPDIDSHDTVVREAMP